MDGGDRPASKEEQPIRVFLLDDHEIVRRGIGELLSQEPGLELVGEAETAGAAIEVIRDCEPDVAVLDVRLGDGSGIEVCREVRSAFPEVQCLILTSFADDHAVVDAAMAGAAGYVLKQILSNDLVESIRKVAAGAQLLDRAEVRVSLQRLRDSEDGMVLPLTPQEQRVFSLIGEGRSNRQIADEMDLAEKTVKNYISNVFIKLGITRRTQAAALAARLDERERQRFS